MSKEQIPQAESEGNNEDSQSQAIPTIELPKGGGAIRGIGEKFAANPVNGTGTMSVPIATSAGRGGFGPSLELSYDSGAGNGPFGFGWSLSLPSISRKTDKGLPRYLDKDESDVFLLSGAEDLVPTLIEATANNWQPPEVGPHTEAGETYRIKRYRPRVEGLFARIERWENIDDPRDVHWRSISRDNILSVYGNDTNSRISDPANPTRIFKWLICETRDDKGNALIYRYKEDDGVGIDLTEVQERNRGDLDDKRRKVNRYLKTVLYGNRATLLDEAAQRPTFLSETKRLDTQWMFEVVFDYGEHDLETPSSEEVNNWNLRDDPFSSYRPGFEVRTTRLCRRVLMFHHFADLPNGESGYDGLVRSTDFSYSHEEKQDEESLDVSTNAIEEKRVKERLDVAANSIYTFLKSVKQTGYKLEGGTYLKRSVPPIAFEYSIPVVHNTVKPFTVEDVPIDALENLPIGIDGTHYRWIDLHGEGIPGVLTEQAGAWHYKRNLSPVGDGTVTLAPLERVASRPNVSMSGGQAQLMDICSDGLPDLVMFDDQVPGFYSHDEDEGWHNFRPFESRLNRDTRDPNLRFIDLDGDGHADVFITEDEAFVWHQSLAEAGFGQAQRVVQALDEEDGPRLIFSESIQTVFLADMSGDGLTDLVRIRNGELCYWPNLGYGRFGAKVTMGGSPHFDNPEQFDVERLRLADIDGSGTIDLIYLHRDGVRLYFNESGNSWSSAQQLNVFPPVDAMTNVIAVDLLGNGTACLVWSSALPSDAGHQMSYVNLLGDQKPHLLIKTINNFGAETHIQYAPSTKFYLQDKRAGKPWITKLPFPVHVVEKSTVIDKWRGTSFSSTYSYHHGYFDGEEREFRGFGRVEQTDVESYGVFSAGNTDSPYITTDQTLYQPPVKTVTWFHTGAALDRERVLSHFEKEYFPNWLPAVNPDQPSALGSFQENHLPEPDLHTQDLDSAEWREALRACKGMVLRQEIYELAVDDELHVTQNPVKLFSAANHNCDIQCLQARESNRFAVFLVTESEAVTYHYELDLRNLELAPDPRIAHTLNLQVDEVGNVLQSVSVVYPRIGRHVDTHLPPGAEELIDRVQKEMHLSYLETCYTDVFDEPGNYRLPAPFEVLTYELTGFDPEDEGDRATISDIDNLYFTLEELRNFQLSPVHQNSGEPVAELDYHLTAAEDAGPTKRWLQHVRMLYFDESLSEPLPFGDFNRLGLPFETYTLALTKPLLEAVFGDKLTGEAQRDLDDASLSGYLRGDSLWASLNDTAGQYWVRSGIAGFAADAVEHFFLPEEYTDPFGNTSTLEFDDLDLYIRSSTDPVGNRVTVPRFDYRILAPNQVRDINNNLSEVAFDILGMPVATALKGKGGEGDSLDGFTADLLDPPLETRAGFFEGDFSDAEAERLLGGATARHLVDFGEQLASDGITITYGHRPASAAGIVRERHTAQLAAGASSPLQIGIEYSDGMGTVLVTKGLAEPEAPGGPLRWIASGKTILNNKGKPVKQYEPYWSETKHRFDLIETARGVGVTPVMYYDAVGRLVRTELPDGCFSRAEFSPWHVKSFDPNDTAKESTWYSQRDPPDPEQPLPVNSITGVSTVTPAQRAAWLVARDYDTPATTVLDSLGREVVAIAHNRVVDSAGTFRHGGVMYREDKYLTHTRLDSEGKTLWIRDARGNLIMQYITSLVPNNQAADPGTESVPCYDIAGNLLFQHSMDAGDRWLLSDVIGQPFYAWDVNDRVQDNGRSVHEPRVYRTRYDELRRPLAQQLRIDGGPWQTVERMIYGEDLPRDEAERRNLRGQLYRHYDSGGLESFESFDFKSNLLEATRQLVSAYEAHVIDWPSDPPVDSLEPEVFTQSTQYDALNRMVWQENWHLAGRDPANYTPPTYTTQYNERGLLVSETLTVRGSVKNAINAIDYNAKGQRTRLLLGNGTITRYEYDSQTFRLVQLRTTRPDYDPRFPEHRSGLLDERVLQQLTYTYDPVGNIAEIYDEAYEPVFFRNQKVNPHSRYIHDSIYRLIEATGREQYGATAAPLQRSSAVAEVSFPVERQDPNGLRNYTQHYDYDRVGNIMEVRHTAERGGWTRDYAYAEDSNRLLTTWTGGDRTTAINYQYDLHGSMLNLVNAPDEFRLHWNTQDMIRHVNLGGGGDVWYNYDSSKQRTRKRIERIGGFTEERFYLGGMELYRRRDAAGEIREEIETYHLFFEDQRVLIVEDVLVADSGELPEGVLLRFQYGNHLGSVGLELDERARVISYEEYHPFGTTAYQINSAPVRALAKRYRYTSMERDDETGLSYHTARYYLPWLGRWGSSDPIGVEGGDNVFAFVSNSPIRSKDNTGTQAVDAGIPAGIPEDEYRVSRVEVNRDSNIANEINNSISASLPPELLSRLYDILDIAADAGETNTPEQFISGNIAHLVIGAYLKIRFSTDTHPVLLDNSLLRIARQLSVLPPTRIPIDYLDERSDNNRPRPDVYRTETGDVWEIKSERTGVTAAVEQAQGYVTQINLLGAEGPHFARLGNTLSDGEHLIPVGVATLAFRQASDGAILYRWIENEPIPVPVPVVDPVTDTGDVEDPANYRSFWEAALVVTSTVAIALAIDIAFPPAAARHLVGSP